MISAYITNLGKYNEGELCGEWLSLPATKEDVQALLSRIGVDGVLYEEIFITDYETDIANLSRKLGEYESLDELNYLAALLSDMHKWEREKYEAVLEYGEYTSSVKDLINLAQNLDCYDYLPSVKDSDDLGRHYVEELGCMDVPEHLAPYIDYEALGRDINIDMGGVFTDNGFVMDNGDTLKEYYSGRDDLPDEHKIFCYPNPMSVKEQLAMYSKMVAVQPEKSTNVPQLAER